ncbi:hypothetical protein AB1Y20_019945 [Prymnesium parvum]|uniref:Uncharacterized protein n=1 Tax=Prymnesium parvum TaxID=97485 RepID=A0AB34JVZ0_PRYPA
MAETALTKAMAPALPKLDVDALEDALRAAKATGKVDPKVIAKAEAKLEQARKRRDVIELGPKREAAEKALREIMATAPFDLNAMKNAITEAEEQKVSPGLLEAAKAKCAEQELTEAMERGVEERERLQKALDAAKAAGVNDSVIRGAERRLSAAWSV